MKAKKRYLIIVAVVAVAVAFMGINGCKKSGVEAKKNIGDSIQLCLGCGQIKGSTLCCQPNQPKCPSCGLVKGSPGCCKISKNTTSAAICTKCGQMKGTELCCKPNQPKCSSCGLVKGSPGCCKIPKQ